MFKKISTTNITLILKSSSIIYLLFMLILLINNINAQEQQVEENQIKDPKKEITSNQQIIEEQNNEQQKTIPAKCGTKETDYIPCITREKADSIFSQCCSQYVPPGCYSLCQYESDELTARNLDNRNCCQHLSLADSKLGVGDRCLRFCDPGSEEGIDSIARVDVTCLFNWNVLMYCHHSGIKLN